MTHSSKHTQRSPDQVWRLTLPVALFLGITSVLWVYFGMLTVGKPLSLRTAILAGLPDWLLWGILARPIFSLGERYRITRDSWAGPALLHFVAGALVACLELFLVTLFNHFFYYNPWDPAPSVFGDAYLRTVLRYFHFAFIIYWLIIAAAHARWYYRAGQQRELEAGRLREQNAKLAALANRAQLDALRAQLQPHFLFNALNAVSGVVRERRTELAAELIAQLSLLLRHAITERRDLISLSDELEVLEAYLAIEQARYRERLSVTYRIDPEALSREVPSLLLQPLVENAIRHGASQSAQPLTVEIFARALPDATRIEIVDDGKGIGDVTRDRSSNGIGLGNTRERLHTLYGHGAALEINGGDKKGTRVVVHLPLRKGHSSQEHTDSSQPGWPSV